jgi:cytochrome c-type biogenesis protein CcmH/NrfG
MADYRMPDQADVDALRDLLDMMVNFRDNDQRARYLLGCNWMVARDARIRSEADKA